MIANATRWKLNLVVTVWLAWTAACSSIVDNKLEDKPSGPSSDGGVADAGAQRCEEDTDCPGAIDCMAQCRPGDVAADENGCVVIPTENFTPCGTRGENICLNGACTPIVMCSPLELGACGCTATCQPAPGGANPDQGLCIPVDSPAELDGTLCGAPSANRVPVCGDGECVTPPRCTWDGECSCLDTCVDAILPPGLPDGAGEEAAFCVPLGGRRPPGSSCQNLAGNPGVCGDNGICQDATLPPV